MSSQLNTKPTLLTVGHSNHRLSHFIELVCTHGVGVIADVRSSPYSKFNPQFNQPLLKSALKESGITYLFLGKELGARRSEPECYKDGRTVYDRIGKTTAFGEGLTEIRNRVQGEDLALMCAEHDPITCHRTILVCHALRHDRMNIKHILKDGSIEPMSSAEDRLLELCGLTEADLFRSRSELLQDAYAQQADRIAYTEPDHATDGVSLIPR